MTCYFFSKTHIFKNIYEKTIQSMLTIII